MAVLDLFAGTGALGFEAASRGAATVVLVEQHRKVAAQLAANRAHLLSKWPQGQTAPPVIEVDCSDAVHALKQRALSGQRFDVVALDPPFRSPLMQAALPGVVPVLKEGGLVYAEWHENLFEDLPALCNTLNVHEIDALRHLKAGQVHAHLFALPAL